MALRILQFVIAVYYYLYSLRYFIATIEFALKLLTNLRNSVHAYLLKKETKSDDIVN